MLQSVIFLVEHYGFVGMFFLVFVENVGVPFPTEPAYVVGQALIARGSAHYLTVLSVITLGHMSGALISYWTGMRIARGLKVRRDMSEMQHKIAHWYEKHGVITVLATRFIGYVRPWSSYVAGIAEVPFWPFFWLTLLGTLAFNIGTLAITNTLLYLWNNYLSLRILILASFSFGFILIFFMGHGRKKRKKEKVMPGAPRQ